MIFTAAGTITHTDSDTEVNGAKVLTMNIDGDLTLGVNAKMSGDFRGFDAGEGPGTPPNGGDGAS